MSQDGDTTELFEPFPGEEGAMAESGEDQVREGVTSLLSAFDRRRGAQQRHEPAPGCQTARDVERRDVCRDPTCYRCFGENAARI